MDGYGALVGWGHHNEGHRLMVRLEHFNSAPGSDDRRPELFRILMTKQQAAVLGNYQILHSGQTPADPRQKSWLRRLFG